MKIHLLQEGGKGLSLVYRRIDSNVLLPLPSPLPLWYCWWAPPQAVWMSRHFRAGLTPLLYDVHRRSNTQQGTDLSLLVSTSLNLSSPPFFSLPPLPGRWYDEYADVRPEFLHRPNELPPAPPLLRPTHIFQSNLSPSLASVLSCSLERSFPELSWWSEMGYWASLASSQQSNWWSVSFLPLELVPGFLRQKKRVHCTLQFTQWVVMTNLFYTPCPLSWDQGPALCSVSTKKSFNCSCSQVKHVKFHT